MVLAVTLVLCLNESISPPFKTIDQTNKHWQCTHNQRRWKWRDERQLAGNTAALSHRHMNYKHWPSCIRSITWLCYKVADIHKCIYLCIYATSVKLVYRSVYCMRKEGQSNHLYMFTTVYRTLHPVTNPLSLQCTWVNSKFMPKLRSRTTLTQVKSWSYSSFAVCLRHQCTMYERSLTRTRK